MWVTSKKKNLRSRRITWKTKSIQIDVISLSKCILFSYHCFFFSLFFLLVFYLSFFIVCRKNIYKKNLFWLLTTLCINIFWLIMSNGIELRLLNDSYVWSDWMWENGYEWRYKTFNFLMFVTFLWKQMQFLSFHVSDNEWKHNWIVTWKLFFYFQWKCLLTFMWN